MTSIFRLPLVPILVVYAAGIVCGQFDLLRQPLHPLFLSLPLGFWLLLILLKRALWASWLALACFFLLGSISIQNYLHPKLPFHHISGFINSDRLQIEGTIDRPPQKTLTGTQLFIKAQQVISENHHVSVEGHLLLFMKGQNPSLRIGDRIRFLCRLHQPHGFHNPGVFSYERHLAFERIYVIGFLSDERLWVKVGEGFHNPLLLKIESWRDHIRHFLERETAPPISSIFQALVLGEQGTLPEDIREAFIATGIAHLLAISGDHLGIVALLSFSLFLWVMKRSEFLLLSFPVKKWAAGLTIPCLLLYTVMAGGGISVIRATLMVTTFFLSILFDRERHLLHTLCLAAFLILLFSPPSLLDVSFQLSFLAVLSILYLVPRLYRHLKKEELRLPFETSRKQKIIRYLMLSFIVTVVAILGTAPFVALHFNRISLVGFIANLLIIPWVGFLIVPISLIASIFSLFLYPLAVFLIGVAQCLTTLLLEVVECFASIPFASLYLPTPTPLEMILFYFLLFLGVHLRKGNKVKYLFVGIGLLLGADMAYWNLKDRFRNDLTLTFIDVGHGDSILVEFPKGKKMLIDGGGLHDERFDIGKKVVAPVLWKKKIGRIDILVLTHPDPDHLKGLNFIASQFKIGQFWDNGLSDHSIPYLQLQQTLSRKKIERFPFDEKSHSQTINGVEIVFLNPPDRHPLSVRHRNPTWLNNQSLVMSLKFKNVTLLLTGDIEREAEERMVKKGHPLRAQVLKVPHHGSATSSTPLFLERVKPDYAIISVGKQTLGRLPHPEVVKRYDELGSKIFRTDQHGAITVVTDGQRIEIKSFLKRNDRSEYKCN